MAARVIRLPNVERLPTVIDTGRIRIGSEGVDWIAPDQKEVVQLRQQRYERDDLILSRLAWCCGGFVGGVTLTVLAIAYAGGWR